MDKERKYANELMEYLRKKLNDRFIVNYYESYGGFSSKYVFVEDAENKLVADRPENVFKIRISDHRKPDKYDFYHDDLDISAYYYDVNKLIKFIAKEVKKRGEILDEMVEKHPKKRLYWGSDISTQWTEWIKKTNYSPDELLELKSEQIIEEERQTERKKRERNEWIDKAVKEGITAKEYDKIKNVKHLKGLPIQPNNPIPERWMAKAVYPIATGSKMNSGG